MPIVVAAPATTYTIEGSQKQKPSLMVVFIVFLGPLSLSHAKRHHVRCPFCLSWYLLVALLTITPERDRAQGSCPRHHKIRALKKQFEDFSVIIIEAVHSYSDAAQQKSFQRMILWSLRPLLGPDCRLLGIS